MFVFACTSLISARPSPGPCARIFNIWNRFGIGIFGFGLVDVIAVAAALSYCCLLGSVALKAEASFWWKLSLLSSAPVIDAIRRGALSLSCAHTYTKQANSKLHAIVMDGIHVDTSTGHIDTVGKYDRPRCVEHLSIAKRDKYNLTNAPSMLSS